MKRKFVILSIVFLLLGSILISTVKANAVTISVTHALSSWGIQRPDRPGSYSLVSHFEEEFVTYNDVITPYTGDAVPDELFPVEGGDHGMIFYAFIVYYLSLFIIMV